MIKIPVHSYRLYGFPEHHFLPNRATFPDYCENIGRVAFALSAKYPDLKVIDIGANIGDTAAIIRWYVTAPILCIEGVKEYFELLERNAPLLGNLALENVFVDSRKATLRGTLTVVKETGTANFTPDEGAGSEVSFESLEGILRRNALFRWAKLVKVDTDGMDGRILSGSLYWLRVARPALFWELDSVTDERSGGPGLGLLEELARIGYWTAILWDNFGKYIGRLALGDAEGWAALVRDYPGGEALFPDVAAFHSEDTDLAERLNEAERAREFVQIEQPLSYAELIDESE